MSVVTNVIIKTGVIDQDDIPLALEILNRFKGHSGANGPGPAFIHMGDSGGSKHLEIELFVAAFNNFDDEAFKDFLKTELSNLPLIGDGYFQIFIQGQEQDFLSEYRLGTIDKIHTY